MITWESRRGRREEYLKADAETRAAMVRDWQENRDRQFRWMEVRRAQGDHREVARCEAIAALWQQMLNWAAHQEPARGQRQLLE